MQDRLRTIRAAKTIEGDSLAAAPSAREGRGAEHGDDPTRDYRDLRELEELHRATLANISDTVLLTDDAGCFVYVCPNVDVIFGYDPDEVGALGSIDALLGAPLFEKRDLEARGEIRNIEREVTIASGARRTVLIHVKAVSISGGTRLYCFRDVTELRQAEEELRAARADLAHASRLTLVGALTASVAHEITQPLTAIVGNASAALTLLGRRRASACAVELREILADIVDEGRLAAEVVHRLRALARKRPLLLQALDVNEVAAETLHFLSNDARRRNVALSAKLESALPLVQGDRVCLHQVLINLFLNAMDAMAQLEPCDRKVLIHTRRVEQGVEIVIADGGHGIDGETFPRLFEPFFTTRKDGVGLGLAIARSIIEAHHGRIWAENRAGRGAAFHVVLPPLGPPSARQAP